MLQQSLLRNEMNEPLAARLRPETLDDNASETDSSTDLPGTVSESGSSEIGSV